MDINTRRLRRKRDNPQIDSSLITVQNSTPQEIKQDIKRDRTKTDHKIVYNMMSVWKEQSTNQTD